MGWRGVARSTWKPIVKYVPRAQATATARLRAKCAGRRFPQETKVGVNESLLIEQRGQNVEIERKYQAFPAPHVAGSQVEQKTKAMALK